MPSSSSQRRQRRLQRQQHLQQQLQQSDNTGSGGEVSPPPPPPPRFSKRQHKNHYWGQNSVSDVTMEDLGNPPDTTMEYSDTSDDLREDSYFLKQHQSKDGMSNAARDSPRSRQRRSFTGESAFRRLSETLTKSSRVVQWKGDHISFSDDDDEDEDDGDDNEDDDGNNDNKNSNIIKKNSNRRENIQQYHDVENFGSSLTQQQTPQPQPHPHDPVQQQKREGHHVQWLQQNETVVFASDHVTNHPLLSDQRGSHNNDHSNNHESRHPLFRDWISNLAYSFRSPATHRKGGMNVSSGMMEFPHQSNNDAHSGTVQQQGSGPHHHHHHHQLNYYYYHPHHHHNPPHYSIEQSSPSSLSGGFTSVEASPLLRLEANRPRNQQPEYSAIVDMQPGQELNGESNENNPSLVKTNSHSMDRETATKIAACFLMDYEAGRPPSLSSNFCNITKSDIQIYGVLYSWTWTFFGLQCATLGLFVAHVQNQFLYHMYSLSIFVVDIMMREKLYDKDSVHSESATERPLSRPVLIFFIVLGAESFMRFMYTDGQTDPSYMLISSLFKPIVFFYISAKSRDALEALRRIGRIVTRIFMIEMFLILSFAAVACRLFHDFESFQTLSTSWLSLFELSTTVVNPSLWMPMYQKYRLSAIFFVFFTIVSVFYLHSLVLSVVFQTYIQAASEIHERSATDRENAVRLAFLALRENQPNTIRISRVRKTLQLMRPHYSAMKINALIEIVDPTNQGYIDYDTFRTKVRQALNASIRTARSASALAVAVELIAVLVAISNFVYVLLLTSEFQASWFDDITIVAGTAITLLGMLELIIRFNPFRFPNFTPITRLNSTFDGLAFCAALVSCLGILQIFSDPDDAVDFILMGRAIDMIRMMRFFSIFRDVVRRSSDILPVMTGPVVLVLTTIHVFVYFGMALWGGAVKIGSHNASEVTPLYDLNNFNSYTEGLVTVFNILVVNDWQAIAHVFLYADRCSHPYIVYPFFIALLFCGVFTMVNVITAFFVESFVTKLSESNRERGGEGVKSVQKDRDITISERHYKRVTSFNNLGQINESPINGQELKQHQHQQSQDDDNSLASTITEVFEFDVYEREGFDQIMRTVAGASEYEQQAYAQSVCDYLEKFESLTPGREKVGYMVCCQQSMSRFGNRRFQTFSRDFVQDDVLHKTVSDMHAELLVLTARKQFQDRCLIRNFPHKNDRSKTLEISASLLRHHPAVSLLVSRIRDNTY